MDLGIAGKTALITASSSGMGRNIAIALAEEGTNVVLFARSAEKLDALATAIRDSHGVRVLAVSGSMQSASDLARLGSLVGAEFGGCDILVLNTPRAPNPLRATLDETDVERWDEAYQNQLRGVIMTATTVLPLMRTRQWGRVVAVTSASVKQPMPHHALSTVFRAGVTAYVKHLSIELGPDAITANCVAPALIETPHRTGGAAYTPEEAAARRRLSPLGRMGLQAEVCGVVKFLASNQAGFVTGATIAVDGGMTGNLL